MLKKLRAKMQDRKGFTLIELMIVIAILGVLAAVAIPYYSQYIENSKMRIARSNYESAIRTVKSEFSNKTAGNPATSHILTVLNDNGRNKNPFNPALLAFTVIAGGAPSTRGEVALSVDDFGTINLGDNVDIGVWIPKAAAAATDTISLTWQ